MVLLSKRLPVRELLEIAVVLLKYGADPCKVLSAKCGDEKRKVSRNFFQYARVYQTRMNQPGVTKHVNLVVGQVCAVCALVSMCSAKAIPRLALHSSLAFLPLDSLRKLKEMLG